MGEVKKLSLLVSLLMATVSLSLAQSDSCTTVLKGQILGQDNKEPLAGATVYVQEIKTGAVADPGGFFRSVISVPVNTPLIINLLAIKRV